MLAVERGFLVFGRLMCANVAVGSEEGARVSDWAGHSVLALISSSSCLLRSETVLP